MLYFVFLKNRLGIICLPHFVCYFSWKMFLVFYSIRWPNLIVWFSFLLEISRNMFISIVCFPDFDVLTFENNLILLIKPFFCRIQISRQKFKYLENEKSFKNLKIHEFNSHSEPTLYNYSNFMFCSVYQLYMPL